MSEREYESIADMLYQESTACQNWECGVNVYPDDWWLDKNRTDVVCFIGTCEDCGEECEWSQRFWGIRVELENEG